MSEIKKAARFRVRHILSGIFIFITIVATLGAFAYATTGRGTLCDFSAFPFCPSPTPTPVPSPTLTPTPVYSPPPGAQLVISDPLFNNSQGHAWDTQHGPAGSCVFASDGYHISATATNGEACLYYGKPTATPDVAIEVTMKLLKGFDSTDSGAGIILRADRQAGGYYFGFDGAGNYTFEVVTDDGDSTTVSALTGTSAYFHKGYGASNVIAIDVQGSTFSAYVNGFALGSAKNATYHGGLLGMQVGAGGKASAEAVFSDIHTWTLP